MYKTVVFILALNASLMPLTTNASTGDAACAMGTYEERWQHRLERVVGGDTVPSMLEDCAMMDRLDGSLGSLARRMFELILPQPGDMEFICGFGTDDVFHEVTKHTRLQETETVDRFVRNIGMSIEESIQHGDIPVPGTSSTVKNSQIYKRIYRE